MQESEVLQLLKIVMAVSIFFVWVVRYKNIVAEFEKYGLPDWLRDIVGICKLSFVIMILSSRPSIVVVGTVGMGILMLFALLAHHKVSNPLPKMLPALTIFTLTLVIYFSTYVKSTVRVAFE